MSPLEQLSFELKMLKQNLEHQEIQTLESTVTSNKLSLLKLASIAMVFRENNIQNKDITIG